MKATCIDFNSNKLLGKDTHNIPKYLAKHLLCFGIYFDRIITTENTPENVFDFLTNEINDLIFIIGEDSSAKNFNIKKCLANFLGLQLELNEKSKKNVLEHYKSSGTKVLLEDEREYFLPVGSMCLKNEKSALQGFILNNKKTYIFMPNEFLSAKYILQNDLNIFLTEVLKLNYNTLTISTFGISEKDISLALLPILKTNADFAVNYYENGLVTYIKIRCHNNTPKETIDNFIRKIYERLNKYIYADEEIMLEQRAIQMLDLYKKTISIASNVAGCEILDTFVKNCNDLNNRIIENINCLNNESLINNLNILKQTTERYSISSVEVAYEMAAGMLEKSNSDIALCITGELSENMGNLICIAVGDNDGIHVYKNIFHGSKKDQIKAITQTAIYYLIKKIKQNDLFL